MTTLGRFSRCLLGEVEGRGGIRAREVVALIYVGRQTVVSLGAWVGLGEASCGWARGGGAGTRWQGNSVMGRGRWVWRKDGLRKVWGQ